MVNLVLACMTSAAVVAAYGKDVEIPGSNVLDVIVDCLTTTSDILEKLADAHTHIRIFNPAASRQGFSTI